MTKTVIDQLHDRRHHDQQHAAGKYAKTIVDAACATTIASEILP